MGDDNLTQGSSIMSRLVVALLSVLALVVGAATLAPAATAPSDAQMKQTAQPAAAAAKARTGKALGYAHVKPGGALDKGRSWRVRPANLVTKYDGFWCFKKLPFKPKSAVVTPDYRGLFNGDIPAMQVLMPRRTDHCPKATQVEVFTGLVDPGSFTEGKKLGFFVVFF